MITTASGFCVSEPMPCESAIGSRPSIASSAVISTVRKRTQRAFARTACFGRRAPALAAD